mgnify:FL=1
MSSVCIDVEIDPLREISNEQLSKGANNAADATLDIHPRGFCSLKADTCKDLELSNIHKLHEDGKKRKYAERVNIIEHGTFTPLVFTTTGGMSKEYKIYYNRLAELIANKKREQYYTTIAWKRAKTCCSLHRSSLVCLRSSRTLKITTNAIKNIDMDIEVKESSIL